MKWALTLLVMLAGTAGAQDATNVVVLTRDQVEIVVTFFPASAKSAPAVILLHDAERTREIWTPLAELLQRNGIAACAVDLRGHGESVRRLGAGGAQRLDVQQFGNREYQDMLLDVNATFDWLSERPEIDSQRIAVIGANLGANLALRYAVFNEDLAALVLLSPSLDDHGLTTADTLEQIKQLPLRIAAGREDNLSFQTAKRLIELRGDAGRSELIACSGQLRGSDLLRGVEGLPQMLLDWLKQVLAKP